MDSRYKSPKILFPTDRGLTLHPFQVDAVREMCRMLTTLDTHGCYNAFEQGCGKTVQAIVTANTLKFARVLILCPAVVRLNWRDEIMRWGVCPAPLPATPHVFVVPHARGVVGIRTHDLRHPVTHVVCSYALARVPQVAMALAEGLFDVIILDEAHYLKTPSARTTKEVLRKIWPAITHRICLSGTPMTQSVMDGYTLFSRLAPDLFPSYYDFADRFAYASHTPFGIKYYGVKNVDTLRALIRGRFFLRRTKDEVLPELPPKVWTRYVLPASLRLLRSPDEDAAHLAYVRAKVSGGRPPAPPSHVLTAYRRQGEKKLPSVIEFISTFTDAGTPLVVFAYHLDFLDALRDAFSDASPAFITGKTSMTDRDAEIRRFQTGNTDLFIGQYTAAGVGVTLTRASHVCLGEMVYSPAVLSQAIDRCHRIGSAGSSVNIYYFVVEDSIDEKIAEILVEKGRTFQQIMEMHK